MRVGGIGWQHRDLSCFPIEMLCTYHTTLLVYLSVFDNPVVVVHLSVQSLSVFLIDLIAVLVILSEDQHDLV